MLANHNNVLVTGGAGFIGSHLVKTLLNLSNVDRIVIFDNLSTGLIHNIPNHSKIQFVKGDLLHDEQGLLEATKNIDIMFHLAAQTSVQRSLENPDLDFEVNATGTLKLLKAAVHNQVKRFVLASTCAVYGEQGNFAITEKQVLKPLSPYASSKAAAEALTESHFHSYNIDSVIIRMFNVYGTEQNADSSYASVIPKFLRQVKKGEPITVYGNGQQTRDYLHVSDAVNGLYRAGFTCFDHKAVQVFNIGTGQSINILDLINVIEKIVGTKIKVNHEPARNGEIFSSYCSADYAHQLLGFSAKVSLVDGINQLWQVVSSNIYKQEQMAT